MTAIKHDRKSFGLGAVSLTRTRPPREALKILNEILPFIDQTLSESSYFGNAPFSRIGLIIRYGLKNDTLPEFQRISKKYDELPLAIEIDIRECASLSYEELKQHFLEVCLRALRGVGTKYNVNADALNEFEQRSQ